MKTGAVQEREMQPGLLKMENTHLTQEVPELKVVGDAMSLRVKYHMCCGVCQAVAEVRVLGWVDIQSDLIQRDFLCFYIKLCLF